MDCAIEPLAEDALLLRFGEGIDPAVNARVHTAAQALRAAKLAGILDVAPAYATLLVRFDPSVWIDNAQRSFERIAAAIMELDFGPVPGALPGQAFHRGAERTAGPLPAESTSVVEIPVCYGREYGPDLQAVAEHAGLATAEVAARHAAAEYTVAMIGFAPGFPYLLGLDPMLRMPRRAEPRTRVPAGSVAIGGAQAGIYPRELPGGWQLIGRTPRVLFDPQRQSPCLLAPGDSVRFRAIDGDEFARLAERP